MHYAILEEKKKQKSIQIKAQLEHIVVVDRHSTLLMGWSAWKLIEN